MSFRDYEEFPYHVVSLRPGSELTDQYLAVCCNIMAARAAFFAMLPERPNSVVQLMHRARIILDSRDPHLTQIP